MTNKEIIEDIKDYLINLYNCTEDTKIRIKLKTILQGSIIKRCKCPMCGEKFDPIENMKYSEKIL